ncbi:MAG TPA: hypothetical protein G4O16_01620 [Dehalococcoidia bacterium]|nr:hypothetical protein [Dehalococcoidia bacterium]
MPTFGELVDILETWFSYPYLNGDYIFYGIVIAFVIGAIWLLSHWPPLKKHPWLWAVAVASAFVTLLAFVFIEVPVRSAVQIYILEKIWDAWTLSDWLLLSTIPFVLIIGLVQEGAKMVPMVFWWARSGRNISPRIGLAIGAMAGAGFGVFQAIWLNNQAILPTVGLPWDAASLGFEGGFAAYWEIFFMVGFHVAASAIAGYGLAKGKGLGLYLLAALLHAIVSYGTILQIELDLSILQIEMYIAGIAVLVTAGILMYRWRKTDDDTMEPMEPVEIEEPVEPAESDV